MEGPRRAAPGILASEGREVPTAVSTAKVILITGASSGIGALTAQRLAAAGHGVWAASRRGSAPDGCRSLVMDVDRDDSVAGAVARVLEESGRLDAAVMCAGFGYAGAVEDTSTDEARAQFETLFFGVHRTCRAVLPAMRAQGQGRIVIVSSLAAAVPMPYQAAYSAAKAAVSNYAEASRFELVPLGIDVACVEPGNFRTGFTGARKHVAGWTDASVHAARCAASVAWMEKDELAAPPGDAVARRIQAIVESPRRPALRHVVVAQPFERIGAALRAWLPARWYEAAALRVFRIV